MGVILYLAILRLFGTHAAICAADDKFKIDENHHIDHGRALKIRVLVLGLIFLAAFAVYSCKSLWWHGLLLLPIGWAWWTMLFRFSLNRMRGLDWRYVSPSNNTDLWWMSVSWLTISSKWVPPFGSMRIYGSRDYYHNPQTNGSLRIGVEWKRMAHRAGAIEYAFELAVFAGSTVAYFLAS